MSSATIKKSCATCRKSGDVFTCRGCRLAFCAKHVDEHREKLSRDVENLAEEHELLRREINRENEAELLLATVDIWEKQSITKISLAAETARTDLRQWIDRNNLEVKIPFERITNELRACQQADDYTETDLKRWIQQLEEYRNKMEKLPMIDMMDDDDSANIHLIKLIEPREQIQSTPNTMNQSTPNGMNQSTPTLDRTIVSFQEPNLLVRERFEDINGGATLIDDGLAVTYTGAWLGDSNACGINLYSSGTHHIRFRILEKFYDSPFFGIITATQKNTEHILECVSTNGWNNFDFPIINGEKDGRTGRDKLIRPMDELTLTLDCERKQIFLKHHRSKRLLHLPIDIRGCPFPWKMLVVLHRRGDSVRIVGGTLSLTRENLSSRLSYRRRT
jgi:hypothetical protein